LVQIFKTGHRNELISRIKIVFDNVLKPEITNEFLKKSSFVKKARVNLAQRIGMIFLKPKLAKWRYSRGSRSLATNLMSSNIEIISSSGVKTTAKKEQEEEEVEDEDDGLDDDQYEQLEFIIQYLLDGLKDEDNIVRWTAAKGVGRITMRLS